MNRVTKHIPTFVDYRKPPPSVEFDTLDELRAIPWVRFHEDLESPRFDHWALSGNCLMAVSDGGKSWWVVGYVRDPAALDLPQWESTLYRASPSY